MFMPEETNQPGLCRVSFRISFRVVPRLLLNHSIPITSAGACNRQTSTACLVDVPYLKLSFRQGRRFIIQPSFSDPGFSSRFASWCTMFSWHCASTMYSVQYLLVSAFGLLFWVESERNGGEGFQKGGNITGNY
jgi:hypothetical protein